MYAQVDEAEAQKALTDFYDNLPTKYKWKPSGKSPLNKASVEQMEQYLQQYNVPNISKWVKGGRHKLRDYLGDRDVFFYSGGYVGYHLADKGGGYLGIRDLPSNNSYSNWSLHPKLLYSWSHSYDTWDITDLVLKKKTHPFLNWLNENPLEVKQ